ncbi:MAG TPA: deoxyhypusine synthase family protein [Acidobacteriota bacterium]|nr:deoxyhypusine synthase family protein [Acidobacteriota bacterium]
MDRRELLSQKIVPFDPKTAKTADDVLAQLGNCSFQGRALSRVLDVWERMCRDKDCLRVISLAGAMIPAGMGQIVIRLIEAGLVDVIVPTGAAMSHDLCNIAAQEHQAHYVGSEYADDGVLRDEAINRIYDTYLPEEGFTAAEDALSAILPALEYQKAGDALIVTTADFCRQIGSRLKGHGVLTAAARHGVTIFIPAISDSELGLTIVAGNQRDSHGLPGRVVFDTLADVRAFAEMVRGRTRAGLVTVGGGVPRNWAQQVYPYLKFKLRDDAIEAEGYHYGVRITTDRPEWGGLSGCTISESKSWGKYETGAVEMSVACDATIALPLMATALFQRLGLQ